MTHDISGPPECAWCGKSYPVASLARACETRHLEETE